MSLAPCRGILARFAICLAANPADLDPSPAADSLPLVMARPDPPRTLLRRLPVLSSLVPEAQGIRWDEAAVYRVQLRVQAHLYCGGAVCYEALLPDTAADGR